MIPLNIFHWYDIMLPRKKRSDWICRRDPSSQSKGGKAYRCSRTVTRRILSNVRELTQEMQSEVKIKYHKAQIPFDHLLLDATGLSSAEDLAIVDFIPPVRIWARRSINLRDLLCALLRSSAPPAAVTRRGVVRC